MLQMLNVNVNVNRLTLKIVTPQLYHTILFFLKIEVLTICERNCSHLSKDIFADDWKP